MIFSTENTTQLTPFTQSHRVLGTELDAFRFLETHYVPSAECSNSINIHLKNMRTCF